MRSQPALPFLALVLAASSLSLAAQVTAGPRHALVIGNGDYAELGKLRNPANDARDMAAALRGLGFEVKLLVDADLASMEDAVIRLGSSLAQSSDSMGFFFYAGHGVQSGGVNYLIPADARIPGETFLKTKALPAQSVLDTIASSRNALNVVVLDACRDNPFSWGRSGSRGLSVVGAQPAGSIIAYATRAGSIAQDGQGRNGVFTSELLKQIGTPGLEINEVFKRTGKAVQTTTAGKQVPAVYNQFFDSAYLAGAKAASAAPAVTAPAAPPPAPTLTVTRAYGSLSISAVTAGTLYLDGKALGELPAGAEASLDGIEVGEHGLELRYPGGEKETRAATVRKGQSAEVVFDWKKEAPPAASPPASLGSAPSGFVLVPAGSFMMGSPDTEAGRSSDEGPLHELRLSVFYLSMFEVTFDEYDAYCAATGKPRPNDQGWGRGRSPVINVSWNDAVEYCNWRSMKEGIKPCYAISETSVSCDFNAKGYRLPTEAEWEYAAKGGPAAEGLALNAVYAGSASLDQVAWHAGNSGKRTHPVGEKAANALGLFDLAGNVWEWCWDLYAGDSYSKSPATDPTGASSGSLRVIRGGSWNAGASYARSANRDYYIRGTRAGNLGFRVLYRP